MADGLNRAKISIGLHQMYVEVESTAAYPDQLDDLSRRAFELYDSMLIRAKEQGVDIRALEFIEIDGDDEDDD